MENQSAPPPLAMSDLLLGLLACGEVFGFHTLAEASVRSSDFEQRVSLMHMAGVHAQAYDTVRQRLLAGGAQADPIIESFAGPLEIYNQRTAPASELEALVKAYVGTGIAADFIREVSAYLDSQTHEFVVGILAEPQPDSVAVPQIKAALAADPQRAGRLALWGRRLMGEAISQAQRVAVTQPELLALLMGSDDLVGFQEMITRMTANHSARMEAIGLYA